MKQRRFVLTAEANDLDGPSAHSIGVAVDKHLQEWGISARVAASEVQSAGGVHDRDGYVDKVRSVHDRDRSPFFQPDYENREVSW